MYRIYFVHEKNAPIRNCRIIVQLVEAMQYMESKRDSAKIDRKSNVYFAIKFSHFSENNTHPKKNHATFSSFSNDQLVMFRSESFKKNDISSFDQQQ